MKLWSVLSVALIGCGPKLSRPGFEPSSPPPTKSPMQLFQEAQADVLSKLTFKFDYLKFSPLDGSAQEVLRVLYQKPPEAIGGRGPILALHVNDLIDKELKDYASSTVRAEPYDIECARDYRDLCPSGWTDLGDGDTCESPLALYENEQCRTVKFGNLTPLEKSAAAYRCGKSTYPCLNECKYKNYDAVCPDGWSRGRLDNEICDAPKDYTVPCVRRYDFKYHSVKLKRKFEGICKVTWPCSSTVRTN